PSIRAVESSFDFAAGVGAPGATDKNSRCVARDVAGNILALRLESRRVAGDVVDPVETGRSDFSRRAAVLFIAGGAAGVFSRNGKTAAEGDGLLRDLNR